MFRPIMVEAERCCRVCRELLRRTLGLTRQVIGSPHEPVAIENAVGLAGRSPPSNYRAASRKRLGRRISTMQPLAIMRGGDVWVVVFLMNSTAQCYNDNNNTTLKPARAASPLTPLQLTNEKHFILSTNSERIMYRPNSLCRFRNCQNGSTDEGSAYFDSWGS